MHARRFYEQSVSAFDVVCVGRGQPSHQHNAIVKITDVPQSIESEFVELVGDGQQLSEFMIVHVRLVRAQHCAAVR
jgi:hypothetical protein